MIETTSTEAVVKSENPADAVSKTKTIYDVSYREIIFRQFVAGAARTLGSLLLYIVFFAIVVQILSRTIWPLVEPFVDQYLSALSTFNTLNSQSQNDSSSPSLNLDQIQQILEQYNQRQLR
jgi:hypothetical protein